jgi:polyhydroxyalkanoate synthesis regulator protein
MAFDVHKLLSTIEATERVARSAMALVDDVLENFSPADQVTLRSRLVELREEREKDFERLQGKLAKLMLQESNNG